MEIEEIQRRHNLRSLHILLVISFVVTGSQLLWEAMGLAGLFPAINQFYANYPSDYASAFTYRMEQEMAIPQWYNLLRALLDITSIVGLVLMWRLHKNGLHAYALSKLLLMLLPLCFLDRSYLGIGDIMLAILFIAYYFYLIKHLAQPISLDPQAETPPAQDDSPDSSQG